MLIDAPSGSSRSERPLGAPSRRTQRRALSWPAAANAGARHDVSPRRAERRRVGGGPVSCEPILGEQETMFWKEAADTTRCGRKRELD
jgi:hypothetical protein